MTEKASPEHSWFCVSKHVGVRTRQIRFSVTLRCDGDDPTGLEWTMPCFQEKPLSDSLLATVLQTDTRGWDENSKALERTQVKELGKMEP